MKSKRLRRFDKAWKLLSEYVRRRDKGVCFTCSKVRPWKEQQAGHFIHGKHTPVYFDEFNVHCQCVTCNHFKSGDRDVYLRNIQKKYGIKKGDELLAERDKVKHWGIKELEALIKYYNDLLKQL